MKLVLPTLALALAASTSAQYYNQSAPFNLVLVSDNKTIDGKTLWACHEGAAIEGLCHSTGVSNSTADAFPAGVFNFNSSSEVTTPNTTLGAPGVITYELHGGNFNVSEGLGLYVNPTTNVALPLFYPGNTDTTTVNFDVNNLLNIQGYIDDTVNPPVAGHYQAYYRWYSCTTYYTGYTYVTLAWVIGEGKPQNPSCVKVDVKRVFV